MTYPKEVWNSGLSNLLTPGQGAGVPTENGLGPGQGAWPRGTTDDPGGPVFSGSRQVLVPSHGHCSLTRVTWPALLIPTFWQRRPPNPLMQDHICTNVPPPCRRVRPGRPHRDYVENVAHPVAGVVSDKRQMARRAHASDTNKSHGSGRISQTVVLGLIRWRGAPMRCIRSAHPAGQRRNARYRPPQPYGRRGKTMTASFPVPGPRRRIKALPDFGRDGAGPINQ